MRKIGSKGGKAVKEKYGLEHMKKIGKRGAKSTKKLWKNNNKENV